MRARNQLGTFFLRHGWHAPDSVKAWGATHRAWMQRIWMEQPTQRVVLQEDLAELDPPEPAHRASGRGAARADRNPAREGEAGDRRAAEPVRRGRAVRADRHGGDRRPGLCRKAPQLFSYAGMVPSEHSSAGPGNERRGAITKAGNAHRRWIVTEAAWHYLRPPKVSAERAHKSEVWRSPRPTQGKGKPRLSLQRRTDGSDQDCPVFRGECADGVQKVD